MVKSDVITNGNARPRACKEINETARLLSLEGAAAYLGVSTDCLRSMEDAGVISRVRLWNGQAEVRRLLYDKHDLDKLIEASKQASTN